MESSPDAVISYIRASGTGDDGPCAMAFSKNLLCFLDKSTTYATPDVKSFVARGIGKNISTVLKSETSFSKISAYF